MSKAATAKDVVSWVWRARFILIGLSNLISPSMGQNAASGAAAAHAVGSKICAACHANIYRDFRKTPMGRSIEPADAGAGQAPVTVYNEKLGRAFQVFSDGARLYQREYAEENGQKTFESTHQLSYWIGSGENGRTPVVKRGDTLTEAPLTYYTKPGKWDLSPGFEAADPGFNRPILEACIRCHSGMPNPLAAGNGQYSEPPFTEMAIGCENCHGPGSAHVEQKGRGTGAKPGSFIVNPNKLSAKAADEICMGCHQGGGTQVFLPGKSYRDLRPGEPLAKTLAIFEVRPQTGIGGNKDLLEHNAAMVMSKCFRASGGKLSCLTCHDPHTRPTGAEADAFYRARCLACHTETSCKIPRAVRGENCVGCHMPKRAVEEISHAALTNHRIVATPDEALPRDYLPQSTPGLPGLIYVNNPGKGDTLPLVTKLTAYGELQAEAPALAAEYQRVFDKALQSIPEDPLVMAAAGRTALLAARYDEAARWMARATRGEAPPSAWMLDLAQANLQRGKETEALEVLGRAEKADPLNATIQKTRVLTLIKLHNYPEALTALRKYKATFPEDLFMAGLLKKVEPAGAK